MNQAISDVFVCWGCGIFDTLFRILSVVAGFVYQNMVIWAYVILLGFWAFYAIHIVINPMKESVEKDNTGNFQYQDHTFEKPIKTTFITTLFVVTLLGLGIWFPKFITSITLEPVADMAAIYSETFTQISPEMVDKTVKYDPVKIKDSDSEFFRPELRDKIVHLMKVTIFEFQVMVKFGVTVIDKSFDGFNITEFLLDLPKVGERILLLILGIYLTFVFFWQYVKYIFYFMDVIIKMAMFAFLFPFTLAFFVLKNSESAEWVKKIGNAFSPSLIKETINAIITLVSAVIVYTIAMAMVIKFLTSGDMFSGTEIAKHLFDGTITKDMLSNDHLSNVTLVGAVILGYLIHVITKEVPKISSEIISALGVSEDKKISDDVAKKIDGSLNNLINDVKKKVYLVASDKSSKPGKTDAKPSGDKKK